MLRKALLAAVVLLVVGGLGLFLWARSVLGGDGVRTTVEAQLTKALGQPVSIGGVSATIFPRVTMALNDVRIGQPARVTVRSLRVGTPLRALLSRRIEHATVRLAGARILLPIHGPASPAGTSARPADPADPAGQTSGAPSVSLVSVDEIVLSDVEIVSGGRTLRGDVDLALEGQGLTIRAIDLRADDTTIHLTGKITDLAGPVGDVTMKAGGLNFVELMAFVTDFSRSAGLLASSGGAGARAGSAPASSHAKPPPMNVSLSIEADRATFGALVLAKLTGRARVTPDAIRIEPIHFGVFGGAYDGALTLTLAETPEFRLKAKLAGVDAAAMMAFAGSPGTLTGTMSGTMDVDGRGLDAAGVLRTARGTARLDLTDGTVAHLGLVRGVVLATSMRAGSEAQVGQSSASEPFSRLGGTFAIANGAARTEDLRFESKDLILSATGDLQLNGRAVNLAGPIQLSDELSKQAGRDLVRLTQKDGRATLPATVTGPVDDLHVRIDVANLAKQAITNSAIDAAKALLKKIGRGGGR
jgi:uncharacterized protein involved in outer membrane biogenesis